MPGEYIKPEKSTIDHEELRASFARAWVSTFNEQPPVDAISLLVAQSCHETDRWKRVWNFSLAGVKAPKPDGLYTYLRTREVLSRAKALAARDASTPAAPCAIVKDDGATMVVEVKASHPWARFRAYRDVDDGAAGILRVLSAQRYAKAVAGARNGDAMAFVRGLKSGGYFTGDEGEYLASVTAKFDEFRGPPCLSSVDEITDVLSTLGYQVGTAYIAAVQRFQAENGLVADGLVGPKTRAAVRSALT